MTAARKKHKRRWGELKKELRLLETPLADDLRELPDEAESVETPTVALRRTDADQRLAKAIAHSGLSEAQMQHYLALSPNEWSHFKKPASPADKLPYRLQAVAYITSIDEDWLLRGVGDGREALAPPPGNKVRLWEANLARFVYEQGDPRRLVEWIGASTDWKMLRNAEKERKLCVWRGRRLCRARLAVSRRAAFRGHASGTPPVAGHQALAERVGAPKSRIAAAEYAKTDESLSRTLVWSLERCAGIGHRWLISATGPLTVTMERLTLSDASIGPRFGWRFFHCREQEMELVERFREEPGMLEQLLLAQRRAALRRAQRNAVDEDDLTQVDEISAESFEAAAEAVKSAKWARTKKLQEVAHVISIEEALARSSLELLSIRKKGPFVVLSHDARKKKSGVYRMSKSFSNRGAQFGVRGKEFHEWFPETASS